MRPLGPGHAQDPSAREGSHLGLFEEMDGIEWMVSLVVLVHEECAYACLKDVCERRVLCVESLIQGLDVSRHKGRANSHVQVWDAA